MLTTAYDLIFRREKYLMKTARFSSVFEKDNWKKSEDSTKVSFYREVVIYLSNLEILYIM